LLTTTWTVTGELGPDYTPSLRYVITAADGQCIETVWPAERMRAMSLQVLRSSTELLAVANVARRLEAEGVPPAVLAALMQRHLDELVELNEEPFVGLFPSR